MDDDELELDSEEASGGDTSQGSVRKNIPLKLKGTKAGKRGRPRNPSSPRAKRAVKKDAEPEPQQYTDELGQEEADLPVLRGPPEPLHNKHKLRWDHRVRLIGEKVTDPVIHSCEICNLPILIYGRMIPCKHVFCYDCARRCDKTCHRCKEPVSRIEQTAVGSVFVCNFDGPRHSWQGCRRTYLSPRDLQAHIDHRHLKTTRDKSSRSAAPPAAAPLSHMQPLGPAAAAVVQVAAQLAHNQQQQQQQPALPNVSVPPPDYQPPSSQQYQSGSAASSGNYVGTGGQQAGGTYQTIPVMSGGPPPPRGSNLISIPIRQEDRGAGDVYSQHPGGGGSAQWGGNSSQLPDMSRPPPNYTRTDGPPPPAGGFTSPPPGAPPINHPPPPRVSLPNTSLPPPGNFFPGGEGGSPRGPSWGPRGGGPPPPGNMGRGGGPRHYYN